MRISDWSSDVCSSDLFTTLKLRAKMLLKPRFGRRRCNGIWPPSQPLLAPPERAVWPFWPWPADLPLPEALPRQLPLRTLLAARLALGSWLLIVPHHYTDAVGPYVGRAHDRGGVVSHM